MVAFVLRRMGLCYKFTVWTVVHTVLYIYITAISQSNGNGQT